MGKLTYIRVVFWSVLFFVGGIVQANAMDVIITNPTKSQNDRRLEYPLALLHALMARTQQEYGPYEIKRFSKVISRKRALRNVVAGHITVFATPTLRDWEAQAIPVRIPIGKGILGYKLFLINRGMQSQFSKITMPEELKKFRFGGGLQWGSTQAFKELGFKVFGGTEYEALFEMLASNRFDCFPRGVNEIFTEYDQRHDLYPHMTIEQELAIYLPQPVYFFVSPGNVKLAERITAGLRALIAEGTLDKLFLQYYGDALAKANLENRRIFTLENPTLSEKTPFQQSELWLKITK
ncbi:MAG: hypothetical protein HWE34_05720 [Methylocystaceae bacterium]|nr:hypothetical protein [Methylocystaceae bacterium]